MVATMAIGNNSSVQRYKIQKKCENPLEIIN